MQGVVRGEMLRQQGRGEEAKGEGGKGGGKGMAMGRAVEKGAALGEEAVGKEVVGRAVGVRVEGVVTEGRQEEKGREGGRVVKAREAVMKGEGKEVVGRVGRGRVGEGVVTEGRQQEKGREERRAVEGREAMGKEAMVRVVRVRVGVGVVREGRGQEKVRMGKEEVVEGQKAKEKRGRDWYGLAGKGQEAPVALAKQQCWSFQHSTARCTGTERRVQAPRSGRDQ